VRRSTLVLFAAGSAVFFAFAIGGLFALKSVVGVDSRGATSRRITVDSTLLGRKLDEIVVAPKGGSEGRPVLVLLHGRGDSPGDFLTDDLFRILESLGAEAPALVLVNGGDHSYYHDRADGPWSRYVLEEALPAGVTKLHADSSRVAIAGFSMGGWGALDLAIEHPGLFCAAGGESAAMWRTAAETPAGAFDDAEDFARHDVMAAARARARPFGKTRVWISVGKSDSFAPADVELAQVLRTNGQPVSYLDGPGGHDLGTFWAQAPDAFRFYADALAACR